MSGCSFALAQGRYTYRHNAVLRQIAHGLLQEINKINNSNERKTKPNPIVFVREGKSAPKRKKIQTGILWKAKDWTAVVDLKKQLKFPEEICITGLRPDMLVKSLKERILIIIELTSPCEENFEVRHMEKEGKYQGLVAECKNAGWRTYLFAVEVGARGYAADSLLTCLKRLGVHARSAKKICSNASDTALRCSFWIWLRKADAAWTAGSENNNPVVSAVVSSVTQNNDQVTEQQCEQRKNTAKQVMALRNEAESRSKKMGKRPADSRVRSHPTTVRKERVSGNTDSGAKKKSKEQNMITPVMLAEASTVVQVSKKRCFGPAVSGLKNLGNTCYLNAVLQCLWLVVSRVGLLRRYTTVLTLASGADGVEKEFWILMNKMSSPASTLISPQSLRSALGRSYKWILNGRQQDAHEMLMILLEKVTRLEKTVSGLMREDLECQSCFQKSPSTGVFSCISIDIPKTVRSHASVHLVKCIEEAFADEMIMDNEWSCSCGGKSAQKSSRVQVFPSILLIHLKRFVLTRQGYRKNHALIKLPETFRMQNQEQYRVIAVVNHAGASMNSGHYTADIQTERWEHCDDARVTNCGQLKDCSSEVYILVCERI